MGEFLSDDARLTAMRAAARRIARPHAGREIIEHLSRFIPSPEGRPQ